MQSTNVFITIELKSITSIVEDIQCSVESNYYDWYWLMILRYCKAFDWQFQFVTSCFRYEQYINRALSASSEPLFDPKVFVASVE